MMKETPLLETLKKRWSKALEDSRMGSILPRGRQRGQANNLVVCISSLAKVLNMKIYIRWPSPYFLC